MGGVNYDTSITCLATCLQWGCNANLVTSKAIAGIGRQLYKAYVLGWSRIEPLSSDSVCVVGPMGHWSNNMA